MSYQGVYYSEYLQLDKILNAQHPESDKAGVEAHDEMLFIVVHQVYELWFKQVMYELESVRSLLAAPSIDDNSPMLQTAVHRVQRVITILRLLVEQINTMETMTPLDFLDFRDLLRPASGFQSYQFKQVEALLGLKLEHRHGRQYYLSHLKPEDKQRVSETEEQPSLATLVSGWLERLPFLNGTYWGTEPNNTQASKHPFWQAYREAYASGLAEIEAQNLSFFDEVLFQEERPAGARFSAAACRSALFIMLYRGYPILQQPFQLLNSLLEVDELLSTWRYRHMNMVHRIIGRRVGTGTSSGKDYLRASLEKHYIFSELADLTTLLAERRKLPELPADLIRRMNFERD